MLNLIGVAAIQISPHLMTSLQPNFTNTTQSQPSPSILGQPSKPMLSKKNKKPIKQAHTDTHTSAQTIAPNSNLDLTPCRLLTPQPLPPMKKLHLPSKAYRYNDANPHIAPMSPFGIETFPFAGVPTVAPTVLNDHTLNDTDEHYPHQAVDLDEGGLSS